MKMAFVGFDWPEVRGEVERRVATTEVGRAKTGCIYYAFVETFLTGVLGQDAGASEVKPEGVMMSFTNMRPCASFDSTGFDGIIPVGVPVTTAAGKKGPIFEESECPGPL